MPETIPLPGPGPDRRRARHVNNLSDAEKVRLWDRMRELGDEIAGERPEVRDLARRLEAELGFQVTRHNVEGAIAAGILPDWREQVSQDDPAGTLPEVSERLAALADRVAGLETVILRLCSEFNLERPAFSAPERFIIPRPEATEPEPEPEPQTEPAPAPGRPWDRPPVAEQSPPPAKPPPTPRRPPFPRGLCGPKADALRNPLPEGAGIGAVPMSQRWRAGGYEFRIAVVSREAAGHHCWCLHVLHHGWTPGQHATSRRLEKLAGKLQRAAVRALSDVGTGKMLGLGEADRSAQYLSIARKCTEQENAWAGLPAPEAGG